jgi:hypothetical protein
MCVDENIIATAAGKFISEFKEVCGNIFKVQDFGQVL